MTWPAPGVYPNIRPSDYFSLKKIDGVLVRSNSMLKQFDRDPQLFKLGIETEETEAMKAGSLFDCLLTSPHRFAVDYVISEYDEFRSKESKEWREAQTAIVVKRTEVEAAVERIEKIQNDARWQEITAGSVAFQVGLRSDIEGRPFKSLLDVLPDEDGPYGDAIVDVKHSGTMENVDDVLRTCRRFNYNHQGGLYRGLANLNGLKRTRYVLFIVPSSGPCTPCVLDLGDQMLANGAAAIMRMDRRLRECERTNWWPSRFDGVIPIEQADETWPWTTVEPELEEAANV